MTELSMSVIIPTIGRESLRDTLMSLVSQEWLPGDCIYVVADGPQPQAEEIAGKFDKLPIEYMETEPTSRWGNYQREVATELSSSDIITFIDDDDVYLPGALSAVRYSAKLNPEKVLLFRYLTPQGLTVWEKPEIKERNISSQCIVVPNIEGLGTWTHRREADFDFLVETLENLGEEPIYEPHLISLARFSWEAVQKMSILPSWKR